jgi:hypothetical protein
MAGNRLATGNKIRPRRAADHSGADQFGPHCGVTRVLTCYELTPGKSTESTNIRSGAVDDSFQFGLLFGGNRELIQRLLKIVQERLPTPCW